jgi:hypothetical protein
MTMSTHLHFAPTHRLGRRSQIAEVATGRADAYPARAATLLFGIGGVGILAGLWGGLAPFVGPTFGYSPDGGGSFHWDLARAMLGALPGAAAVVAGLLVLACARSAEISVGRGGIVLAGAVLFASGAWLALGPVAWPVLWSQSYFVHSSAMSDFGRVAGFAAGPGLVLTALSGLTAGALVSGRGRSGYLVTGSIEPETVADREVRTVAVEEVADSGDVPI